jgi:hypothetical protein
VSQPANAREDSRMKYTIYEHPGTHQFAVVRLPAKYAKGDAIPLPTSARWFDTREEVVATLSGLFDEENQVDTSEYGDASIPE